MKRSLLTFAILITCFAASSIMTSCGGKKEQATEEQTTPADTTKQHEDMAMMTHACPMHPEEKGKEGDTCSKCGMKLEASKADSTKSHSEHQH